MKNKYEKVSIKVSNQAEKLAAILFLANISGAEYENTATYRNTLEGIEIDKFPYVIIDVDNSITGRVGPSEINIKFADIGKLDEIIKKHKAPVEVKLNESYTAIVSKDTIKVGCQTFKIGILTSLLAAHKKVSDA